MVNEKFKAPAYIFPLLIILGFIIGLIPFIFGKTYFIFSLLLLIVGCLIIYPHSKPNGATNE